MSSGGKTIGRRDFRPSQRALDRQTGDLAHFLSRRQARTDLHSNIRPHSPLRGITVQTDGLHAPSATRPTL